MTTKHWNSRRVRQLAHTFHCQLTAGVSGFVFTIIVDSPPGYVFRANYCHSLCASTEDGVREWREACWEDMGERLVDGLARCDTLDCDVCDERRPWPETP